MQRQSVALFLSTLTLAGGVVACSSTPGSDAQGDQDQQELTQPSETSPEGGEGGEGGEG